MSILRETAISCILALSLFGLAACGGEDPTPSIDIDDPNDPDRVEPDPVEPDPCLLRFDSEPLRWSAVGVGYSAEQPIEFSNEGDEICLVTLGITGEGFAAEDASFAINPDATRTVAVTWSPTAAGATAGTLGVTSGEVDEEIALDGEAVASCLTLSPEVVDFGEAAPRCRTVVAEVQIENGCSHPVMDASFTFESGDESSPGAVFGIRQLPPGILAPGATPMTLAYRPLEVGEDEDVLTLLEENGATSSVALHGVGRLDARSADSFEQGTRARADLLFVIDDSPAMAPYAADLRSFGEEMATRFSDRNHFMRWGVTTTSRTSTAGCDGSGADGRIVPFDGSGPRWLDIESDLPATDFGDLLDVGTCSLAPNEGLASAVRALTDPLVSQADDAEHPELDDGNLGFRRPGLGLSIVFVSASDDTSSDSVEDIRTALVDVVGGPGFDSLLHVGAIVAPAGGCEAAIEGARYAELVDGRGEVANLCDETTWTELLNFGSIWHPFTSRFFLSARPQDADANGDLAGEITVEVDGEEVAAIGDDGEVRWTYDAGANAVDFALEHIPAEGSQIRITYFQDCR